MIHFFVFLGRLKDHIVISYNNEVLGEFDESQSFEAHALQFGALWLYDASYEVGLDGKKLPPNIRYFFQFLSVYFWDIRIKEKSSGTGVPNEDVNFILKRINDKVKELWDLTKPKEAEESEI